MTAAIDIHSRHASRERMTPAEIAEGLRRDRPPFNSLSRDEFQLFLAAINGGVKQIRKLTKICHVDCTDQLGRTPLHAACDHDHPKCAQLLLAAKADPHKCSSNQFGPTYHGTSGKQLDLGSIPLLTASHRGSLGCVRLLLSAASYSAFHLESALLAAMTLDDWKPRTWDLRAQVDCVRALVAAGADPALPIFGGKGTALQCAVRCEDADFAIAVTSALLETETGRAILESRAQSDLHSQSDLNSLSRFSFDGFLLGDAALTPLAIACRYDRCDIVAVLLRSGASINGSAANRDSVPLIIAAGEAHPRCVQRLLEANADADIRAPCRASRALGSIMALAMTKTHTQMEVEEFMAAINARLDSSLRAQPQSVPLTLSCHTSDCGPVNMDLHVGCRPSDYSITPLHAACCFEDKLRERLDCLELLVGANADVGATCCGITPMRLVIESAMGTPEDEEAKREALQSLIRVLTRQKIIETGSLNSLFDCMADAYQREVRPRWQIEAADGTMIEAPDGMPPKELARSTLRGWRKNLRRQFYLAPNTLPSAATLCAACNRERYDLRLCKGCFAVSYCDVACQRWHWKNGHKADCKAYRSRSDCCAAQVCDETLR